METLKALFKHLNPHLCITQIIRGPDGKLVLTKLAVATAHLSLAVTVAWITYLEKKFILEMWTVYLGVTILHEQGNKAMTKFAAFKEKKLDQSTSGEVETPAKKDSE